MREFLLKKEILIPCKSENINLCRYLPAGKSIMFSQVLELNKVEFCNFYQKLLIIKNDNYFENFIIY